MFRQVGCHGGGGGEGGGTGSSRKIYCRHQLANRFGIEIAGAFVQLVGTWFGFELRERGSHWWGSGKCGVGIRIMGTMLGLR
jgi:hypothetical protein